MLQRPEVLNKRLRMLSKIEKYPKDSKLRKSKNRDTDQMRSHLKRIR